MKLLTNSGTERVVDELRRSLEPAGLLDVATPEFSLFAYAELRDALEKLGRSRVVMPAIDDPSAAVLGTDADRSSRNRLQARWLAKVCSAWLEAKTEIRALPGPIPQSTLCVSSRDKGPDRVITGACSFTTHGLGLAPLLSSARGSSTC